MVALDAAGLTSGDPVERRTARALIAWMPAPEAVAAILGRTPGPSDDLAPLHARHEQARQALAMRPLFTPAEPVEVGGEAAELTSHVDMARLSSAFAGFEWQIAIADLTKVQSFQKVVIQDGMEERIGSLKHDVRGLLPLCIPMEQITSPLGAFTDPDGKGFTVSSLNPNLRVMGAQVSEAMVAPDPDANPIKMQALTFLISMGSSYLQVVGYQGRFFIRDGYHRAAALLRLGVSRVPCIYIEAAAFEQVGTPVGSFTYELLYGPRPPLLSDFWAPVVSEEIQQVAVRKVVRVRADEFVTAR